MKRAAAIGLFDFDRPSLHFLKKLGVNYKEVAWQDGLVYVLVYTGRIPTKTKIMKLLSKEGFEPESDSAELNI